jgi:phosphatidate cytidylyltransferase
MTTHQAQDRANRWRDLRIRALSTLVMIPAAAGAILAGGIVWQLVLGALTAGALIEWAGLSAPAAAQRTTVIRAGGFIYIALAYVSLISLHARTAGAANVLFVVLTVAAGDIGAYVAGRLIGGAKLAPSLSPGKTRSGAAGGLAAGIAAGTALAAACGPGKAGLLTAAILAACLSVVAQAGDLLESAMKRRFGKKDSSQLIPGHGGLLDRLDGLLAAAPVAAGWLALRQGVYLWQ